MGLRPVDEDEDVAGGGVEAEPADQSCKAIKRQVHADRVERDEHANGRR